MNDGILAIFYASLKYW